MKVETRILKQKQMVLRKMLCDTDIVQGTIVKRAHTCGKVLCRCRQSLALRHHSYQLTFAVDGKTRTVTIPKDKLAGVRKGLKQYRHLRQCVKQLVEINRSLIKRHPTLPIVGNSV